MHGIPRLTKLFQFQAKTWLFDGQLGWFGGFDGLVSLGGCFLKRMVVADCEWHLISAQAMFLPKPVPVK